MSRKKIGFGMVVLLLCMLSCVSIWKFSKPVQATAGTKGYSMGGADFDDDLNVTKKYYLKTNRRKLVVNGTIYYSCGSDYKVLKRKKRTFTIAPNCKFICNGYDYYDKETSYSGKNYKRFAKLCKYWMDGRGDKKTGTYNSISFQEKQGKVCKIVLSWDPYEGG